MLRSVEPRAIVALGLIVSTGLFEWTGCLSRSTRDDLDRIARAARDPSADAPSLSSLSPGPGPAHRARAEASPIVRSESDERDEAALALAADWGPLLRLALSRSPERMEAQARTQAAVERARAAGGVADLELKYEQWGVPLSRPWALDHADSIMVGLRQSLPPPGMSEARARVELASAGALVADQRRRTEDLVARLHRAWIDYARAVEEQRIHEDHMALASRVIEIARAGYRSGRGSQQDVLRWGLEMSRLHTDVAFVAQEEAQARALLNALSGRAADAPLGPPPGLDEPAEIPEVTRLESSADRRPEIEVAARAVERGEAEVKAARIAANSPGFMIGADYWYMPMRADPHAYSAMLAMTLPWLNPRRRDEVRAAEAGLAAERAALRTEAIDGAYRLRAAAARVEASRHAYHVIEKDLLVQARHAYESAESAYSAGQLDGQSVLEAARSYHQARIERVRALSRVHAAVGDVGRVIGARVVEGGGQ